MRLQTIDTALLYKTPAVLDFADLLGLLNAHLGDSPLQFALSQEVEGELAVFAHKDLHILVTAEAQPLAAEGFKGVLDSPFCSIGKAATTAIVAGHHGNVLVSVGNGPDAFADPAPAPREDTLDLLETKLILCQLVANLVIDAARPEAVHWCQSNQLFGTDDFLAERDSHYPLKLYLHPVAHQSGASLDGQRMIGFSVPGSEQFIGKPLVFAEGPLAFEQAFEHMADFVTYCRNNTFTFPDGDRFGRNKDEQVIVRHLPPTATAPAGQYELGYVGANDQRADAAKTRAVRKVTPPRAKGIIPVSKPDGPVVTAPALGARLGALLPKRRKDKARVDPLAAATPVASAPVAVQTPKPAATTAAPTSTSTPAPAPAPDRYSQEAALRDAFRAGNQPKRARKNGAATQSTTEKPAVQITKFLRFPAKVAAAVAMYFAVMQGVQYFSGTAPVTALQHDMSRPATLQTTPPPHPSQAALGAEPGVEPSTGLGAGVLEQIEPVADIVGESF